MDEQVGALLITANLAERICSCLVAGALLIVFFTLESRDLYNLSGWFKSAHIINRAMNSMISKESLY